MSDSDDVYGTAAGEKLCVIFRDNPKVRVQPIRDAFGKLNFELVERDIGDGEADTDVVKFFEDLAVNSQYSKHCCLVVVMAGCYSARPGWGINVNGLDVDFERLLGPFVRSQAWLCKPKVWLVQYQSETEHPSTVSCDVSALPPSPGRATAFADTAIAVGYGGPQYTEILCQLVQDYGSKMEFHQLMTLLNARVQAAQQSSQQEDAPLACGFASQLTKELFLAAL